jgi:hypothetical protein
VSQPTTVSFGSATVLLSVELRIKAKTKIKNYLSRINYCCNPEAHLKSLLPLPSLYIVLPEIVL